MLTTKSQNALKFLIALSLAPKGIKMTLKEITDAENLPHAYLEQILPSLRKAGIVKAYRGSYGGYTLLKPAEELTIWDIISAVEQSLDQTACHSSGHCQGNGTCKLHSFLDNVNDHMQQYFQSITLNQVATPTNTHSVITFQKTTSY